MNLVTVDWDFFFRKLMFVYYIKLLSLKRMQTQNAVLVTKAILMLSSNVGKIPFLVLVILQTE
jgi:hypothetical protein